ncbi:MAG TPA: site-specific integrase [Negativicutes bacterium]|nr:site-specific integrase [Negativicutes bacterium]
MGKRANGEGTIYKKKPGLWCGIVTVGRDTSTGKLVRKTVYGKTKLEAQEKKTALLEKSRGGLAFIDADKLTVGQWIEKWLTTYAKNRVRQNTYESYDSVARLHIIPVLGSIRLQKLQTNQIQGMVNTIAEKYVRTARYAFTVLRMAMKQALQEDLIFKNPSLAVSLPELPDKEVRKRTPDEWERLFVEAKIAGIYLQVLLVWATGMRREEILGLRWSDVNFGTAVISIANVVIVTKDGPKFAAPKSKSGYRQIPIPKQIISTLRRHKKEQAAKKLEAENWTNNDLVVCDDIGGPLDPRNFSKAFSEVAKSAKVTCTFHDLRHDHATRLFAGGWHPKDVQDRLGHANISMTMDIYTHHIPERQNGIAAWLGKNIPPAVKKR